MEDSSSFLHNRMVGVLVHNGDEAHVLLLESGVSCKYLRLLSAK